MPGDLDQLETRHAPATFSSPAPEKLSIPVPPAFQDYLIHRHQWATIFAFIIAAVVPFVLFRLHFRHLYTNPYDFSSLPGELLVFWLWRRDAKKPWYYEFRSTDAKLIQMEQLGWSWTKLNWRENNYVAVERTTWERLPALAITRRSRYFWQRTKLMLVYSDADEPLIEQIIPFMAKHGTLVSEGTCYQRT